MAAKRKIWCDGRLIEVSDEVYVAYIKGERKFRYFEKDLKEEKIKINVKTETVRVVPSREDSLERLTQDNNIQFEENMESVESVALMNVTYHELHKAISKLAQDEQTLIYAMYFEKLTERQFAERTGVNRNAVHKRKTRILAKLKNILENL